MARIDETAYDDERIEAFLRRRRLSRRAALKLGAAFPVAAGLARFASAGEIARAAGRDTAPPIVKPLPAEWFVNYGSNAEMRWDAVSGLGYTIPNERFFVRDHTATPTLDVSTWSLQIFGDGLSGAPVWFTYAQLQGLPQKEIVSFVECAGNGRGFFGTQQGTPVSGTQWGLGGIGVARWRGVALAELLERAGATSQAVDVMPYGLDKTVVSGGVDYGHVRRPIPIAKALDNALLALEMNGQTLPFDHGYPARLIVPGWVGVANVKWVGQIEVSKEPLFSLWNTQQYTLQGAAYPDKPVVTTQVVKSAWELAKGATLQANVPQTLHGRAWSGEAGIHGVDVSTDRGVTWTTAELLGRNGADNWVQFQYQLPALPAGAYELWARARDNHGRTQPSTVPLNSGGYLFGAIVRHPIVLE